MSKEYYGYYKSKIGILKIVTSDEALLSLNFIDDEKIDKENLESVKVLEDTIIQLDEYFNGTRREFDISFKLNGTTFQTKAWSALSQIPYGKTISYKEQAIKLGNEKAARAVGGANNKNKIAIIIPCHRVIGSNKSLVGYAGGLSKKQWLLEHEKNNL